MHSKVPRFSLNSGATQIMSNSDAPNPPPWYAAYPAPSNKSPASITREQVLSMLKEENSSVQKDFVLVDLRRIDHEVIPVLSFAKVITSVFICFRVAPSTTR